MANYKVSRALAETLAACAAQTSDARAQEILNALSLEFSEFSAAAGQRIVQASAFADSSTTVEEALGEMFRASPDYVASLLSATPGVEWSTYEIAGAIQDLLVQGESAQSILTAVRGQGIGSAAQSMTDLSLGLEADMRAENAPSWHAVAAKAGGAALLLDALFNTGYTAAMALNTGTAFYEDDAVLGMVSELLSSPGVDFSVVPEYLPPDQALAWLVHAIDAGFTTDELNQLMDATTVSADGVEVVQRILTQLREVLVPVGEPVLASDPAAYYRAVFSTIGLVQTTYGDTLKLESLVAQNASLITARAATDTEEGIAYRYALVELNGFALVGADYAPLNGNGELDLYDASTGRGTLTLQYLADRPELLAGMLAANTSETRARCVGRNTPRRAESDLHRPGLGTDPDRHRAGGGHGRCSTAASMRRLAVAPARIVCMARRATTSSTAGQVTTCSTAAPATTSWSAAPARTSCVVAPATTSSSAVAATTCWRGAPASTATASARAT